MSGNSDDINLPFSNILILTSVANEFFPHVDEISFLSKTKWIREQWSENIHEINNSKVEIVSVVVFFLSNSWSNHFSKNINTMKIYHFKMYSKLWQFLLYFYQIVMTSRLVTVICDIFHKFTISINW